MNPPGIAPAGLLVTDLLLVTCLLAFCVAWLWRGLPRRTPVLWVCAAGAAVFGVLSVLDGRWQAAVGGLVAVVLLVVLAVRGRRRPARAPSATTRVPFVSGTVFLLLSAVAVAPLYLVPVFDLPDPGGEHPVGVRDVALTDTSRLGVLDAPADQPRRLAVRVWYPAATTDGLERRPYATATELDTTYPWLASHELGLPSFFYSHLGHVRTHSYPGAPVLDGGQPLPVVFFSHGLDSYVAQNTALMEHLASRGYVVFSVAHPFDAAPVAFPDGTVLTQAQGAREQDPNPSEEAKRVFLETGPKFMAGTTYDERFQGLLGQIQAGPLTGDRVLLDSPTIWVDDVLFVENVLAKGLAPEGIADIVDRADLSRVAHTGMSFGGSTAAALAYADPRCAAAINLDSSDFHYTGVNTDIPVPFLMLYSDSINALGVVGNPPGRPFAYNDFSHERFETAGTREDVVQLQINGSTHPGVSDTQLMTRGPLHTMLTGPIDGRLMLDVLNDVVTGFLDTHLRGLPGDFPQQQFTTYADVAVRHDASGVREWWLAKSAEEQATLLRELDAARSP